MPSRNMIKLILKWVGRLLLVALLIGIILLAQPAHEFTRVMVAHAAKVTCSERFIAGRSADDILVSDIYARRILEIPILNLVRVSVDDAAKRTSSSMLPFYRDQAVYRDGLGCVLVREQTAEALQAAPSPAVTININEGDMWPLGRQVAYPENPLLEAALGQAFVDPNTGESNGTRAIVVVQGGQIIGERYAPGFDGQSPMIGWSMSKTVTAMLAGIAIERSDLTLETGQIFPEWDDERAEIQLKDLLAMSDGLDFVNGTDRPSDELRQLYLVPDTVSYAKEKAAIAPPNERFNYSNGSTSLVMGAMRQHFPDEQSWLNFPYEALFEPLGMSSAVFETDAQNNFVGSSLLYASPRDWARLGLLLQQDGQWFGEQVLPAGWASYIASGNDTTGGWYGRGFTWRGENSWNMGRDLPQDDYWFQGFDGQYVIIIPSRDLVIVRLGFTPNGWGRVRPELVDSVLQALQDPG